MNTRESLFKHDKMQIALWYYNLVDMEIFTFNHTQFRVNMIYNELQMVGSDNTWLSINANDFITGNWNIEKGNK